MQFPEYDEVCEECGMTVDAGELRAHPDADKEMENPPYICQTCQKQWEMDELEADMRSDDGSGESAQDITREVVYEDSWSTDLGSSGVGEPERNQAPAQTE